MGWILVAAANLVLLVTLYYGYNHQVNNKVLILPSNHP